MVYDFNLTLYERAYYIKIASMIPPYSKDIWIPKDFVDEERIINLKKQNYLVPYLDGYKLPKEEVNL